jgi:hypothetical protein
MKPGDLVLIRVVGLGAYMRKFHDEPALIVATHSKRGKPLTIWRILWHGKIIEVTPDLLVPCNPPADVV